jgi:hypothetical protein
MPAHQPTPENGSKLTQPPRSFSQIAATGAAVAGGVAAASYAALAATAWARFGHMRAPADWPDPLLDGFMPAYDIEERHQIRVAAPPLVVFRTACTMDLNRPLLTRAIFKARELVLGAEPDRTPRPTELIPFVKSLGWGVLAEIPDREIVMGGATQPWQSNPVFHSIAPAEFATFNERDYVKIAWTLRAEPLGGNQTLFLTETRATTTNDYARRRFRRYWSFVSPGIVLIRRLSLRPLKADAERYAAQERTERTERAKTEELRVRRDGK